MAFICLRCAGPSGVSEFEQLIGGRSSGPCECCGVNTTCIDSYGHTSLTNGRVTTRKDSNVLILAVSREASVLGVHVPVVVTEPGKLADKLIGHSLEKAIEWLATKGWTLIDPKLQEQNSVNKDPNWADCAKHFFAQSPTAA